MVAAAPASSRSTCAADAMASGGPVATAEAGAAQPRYPRAGRGDLSPIAGLLLAVAVSLPLWGIVVVIAHMLIA